MIQRISLLLIGFGAAVEMMKDDSLCRETMHSLIPGVAPSASVIAALVQLDATFGVTPCEYNRMKGISTDGAASPDLDNHFQAVDSTNDPNRQALQAMSDASDDAMWGQTQDRTSAASRAGARVGGAVRNGPKVAVKETLLGVKNIAAAIGVPNVDINLDVFKDFKWKMNSEWAFKAGQGLYDVTSVGLKGAYDFSMGVMQGVLGPSVQGRRRVVFDRDCDMVTHTIDTIESTCESYRYDKLVQMYPMIQMSAGMDFGVTFNRTRLNNTFEGDPLSFVPGVKDVFVKHQEALYGVGGTCLDPTKGSIAAGSSNLARAEFDIARDLGAGRDTAWTDLQIIDSNVKEAIAALVEDTKNITLKQLDLVAKSGQDAAARNQAGITEYLRTVAELTTKLVKGMNKLQDDQLGNFESIDAKWPEALDVITKATSRLMAKLDLVSDTLYNSPQGRERFTDTLVQSVNRILSSAQAASQSQSRDQTGLAVTNVGSKYLEAFAERVASSIAQTGKSWSATLGSHMSTARSDYIREQSKVGSSKLLIDNEFASSEAAILSDLGGSAANATRRMSVASTASADSSSATKTLQSQTVSADRMMTALLAALENNDQETVANIAISVSNVLNEASAGAGDQLRSIGQGINFASSDMAEARNGLSTTFSQLISQVSNALAARAASAAAASGSQTGLLQKSAAIGTDQLQTLNTYRAGQLDAAGADWERLGDEALGGLSDIMGDIRDSQATATTDANTALRMAQSQLRDKVADSTLGATAAARVSRATVQRAGKSTLGMVRAAGSDLGNQHDLMVGMLGGLATVNPQRTSAQTATLSSGVASALASSETSTANSFAASMHQAKSSAGTQLDQAQFALSNKASMTSSSWQAQVGKLMASIDSSTDRADISTATASNSVDQASFSLNALGAQFVNDGPSVPTSWDDSIKSAAGSSGGLALRTVAGLAQDFAALENNIQQVTVNSPAAPSVSRPVDAADNTVLSADREVLKAGSSVNSAIGALMTISSAAEAALADTSNSESSFALQTAALKTLMQSTFSSALSRVGNLNTTITEWNASQPTNISSQVHAFIDELGANGLRLMDQISAVAQSGVGTVESTSENFGSASIGNLAKAGALADNLTIVSPQNSDGLDGLTNKISDAKKYLSEMTGQAVSVQEYQAASLAASQRDAAKMQSQLDIALSSSNSSLTQSAKRGASDASFQANIAQSQNSGLLRMADSAIRSTDTVSSESGSSLAATLTISTSDLAALESNLQGYSDRLSSQLAAGLAGVDSLDSGFAANISSDKDQMSLQVKMAQRSVRDLLDTWGNYAEYETGKFRKMNASDYEYLAVMGHRLEAANSTAGGALRTSKDGLATTTSTIMDALRDYISFRNYMQSGVADYRAALKVFNQTTDLGIGQVKESIYNLNANDDYIDHSRKSQLEGVVRKFESDIDAQAKMVSQSVAR